MNATTIFGISFFLVLIVIYALNRKAARDKVKSVKLAVAKVYKIARCLLKEDGVDIVITLIERYHIDINAFTHHEPGLNLFLCACLSGQPQLLKYLLDRGADVHVKSEQGEAPLYLATYGLLNRPRSDQDLSALGMLINAGCGVNEPNSDGYTPLHLAADKGNVTVVDYLLDKGADRTLFSKDGMLPLYLAQIRGFYDVAIKVIVQVNRSTGVATADVDEKILSQIKRQLKNHIFFPSLLPTSTEENEAPTSGHLKQS